MTSKARLEGLGILSADADNATGNGAAPSASVARIVIDSHDRFVLDLPKAGASAVYNAIQSGEAGVASLRESLTTLSESQWLAVSYRGAQAEFRTGARTFIARAGKARTGGYGSFQAMLIAKSEQ